MTRAEFGALPDETLIDTKTLAEGTGLAASTWAKRRWSGDGPAFIVLGSRRVYKVGDIRKWLEQHRVASTADGQSRGLVAVPTNKGTHRAAAARVSG